MTGSSGLDPIGVASWRHLKSIWVFAPRTFCYPGNSRSEVIVELAESVHLGTTKGARHFYGGDDFDLEAHAAWLDQLIEKRESHNAMIHGIVPDGGGWKPFASQEVFENVLQQMKEREDKIWFCRVVDLCAYQWAVQHGRLEISSEHDGFKIAVSYDEEKVPAEVAEGPLSLLLPASEYWQATQAGEPLNIHNSDSGVVLTFFPKKGPLLLHK